MVGVGAAVCAGVVIFILWRNLERGRCNILKKTALSLGLSSVKADNCNERTPIMHVREPHSQYYTANTKMDESISMGSDNVFYDD